MKKKITTQDLPVIRERIQKKLAQNDDKIQVRVHLGTCGISSGADKTLAALEREVAAHKLTNVIVLKASCIGLCGREPTVTVIHPTTGRLAYYELTEDKVPTIVEQHFIKGRPVKEWAMDGSDPRFKLQVIRVMHNQDLDPMNIEEYISRWGYQALAKVLSEMTPEAVLEEIKKAGLRGRGGAGFPTATKWGFVRSAKGDPKYVVCNGDEGDPGAYMNRAVLEGNPHSIIEGMAIGAYAIGNVKNGYAYVRAEYPLAIKTLNHAIAQAHEYGLLGKNILGTDFEFDLEIFPGAGAFVCGEETALLASIEGKRGTPRQRPPFPANAGLFDKPTTLNNVETWSNVPLILLNGAEWFASVGSETCKGTKTLCLVGKINNTGLIEVPLGTTLGQIIFDLGGGIPNGKKFKAVQLGGPSGGVITAEYLNTPVDYTSIPPLGAIMGSGGMVVMDEDSCMVDVARYFLDFTKDESCGKCISCREGNPKMYDILTKITQGKGTESDIPLLRELTQFVSSASICGLGQTAPNPVLTTLRYFPQEYESHIIDKKCPSAVCQSLFKAPCQHTCPVGLDIPGYVALIKDGRFEEAYKLIMQRLPMPLTVGRVCPHPCEAKCQRNQVDESVAIRHLKRFAADYAYEHGFSYIPEVNQKKSERVAIIGAGPAGLSAAWDLARYGYPVTVFDELPVAGGMLAVGIPEYRLPKDMLNHDIDNIRKIGVDIQLNHKITDIDSLYRAGYKAVFVAIGAHKGYKMGIPGDELNGVYDAVDFLRRVSLGEKPEIGQKVVVVGGGNSAIDAARVALKIGAKDVRVLYRREKTEMPAEPEEIAGAEEEGVRIDCLKLPDKVIGKDGKVAGMECIRMVLTDFGKDGRRRPEAEKGSQYVIEADTLIEAIGQEPDFSPFKGNGIPTDKNGRVLADRRTLAVNGTNGIFIGGDALTGPATVIEAIAAGQRAAYSIKQYLSGEKIKPVIERTGEEQIFVPSRPPTEEETKPRARVAIDEISATEKRKSLKEIVVSYTPKEARDEASRCLRCDLQ